MEELKGLISEVKENQITIRENQTQEAVSNAQECALIPVNSDTQWGDLERLLKDNENRKLVVSTILLMRNKLIILFYVLKIDANFA